jgi:hypothetical protein
MGNAGKTASPLGQTDPTQDTSGEASVHGQTWKIDGARARRACGRQRHRGQR